MAIPDTSPAGTWRRPIGLSLLALVIFLWTATSFLASAILADADEEDSFRKPFFVTYCNTAVFVLPGLPILARKLWTKARWKGDGGHFFSRRKNSSLELDDETMSSSIDALLKPLPTSENDSLDMASTNELTLSQTARLSLPFALLWFVANYTVIACLQHTTVASSTILTSTSGIFTLLFGILYKIETFSPRKLLGVLASLLGIALISSSDYSGSSSTDTHRGTFPSKTTAEMAWGNTLAFFSAGVYGFYAVLTKKSIPAEVEKALHIPVFFFFLGAFNILLLWPLFPLLHFTGIEPFVLPPWRSDTTTLLLVNAAGSCVSDLAWIYAVLLTSPLVVTVGLSLTIPLSLVGQVVVHGQTVSVVYWVGAGVVLGGFVVVNQEEGREGSLAGRKEEGGAEGLLVGEELLVSGREEG